MSMNEDQASRLFVVKYYRDMMQAVGVTRSGNPELDSVSGFKASDGARVRGVLRTRAHVWANIIQQ